MNRETLKQRDPDAAGVARAVFEYLHERISLGRLAELTGLNQAEWDRLVTIPGVLARERMAVLAFVDAFSAWWATDPEVGINEEPDDLLRRFLATRQTGEASA
jgi:hypothetical protein